MRQLERICKKYNVSLCYLFGSQAEKGLHLLQGEEVEIEDRESDLDFAVLFRTLPENIPQSYAKLINELQDMVTPFHADLVFLHEVDHLIQLEAISGYCIYAESEEIQSEYEERVMMFAADEIEIFRRNEKDLLEAIEDGYREFEYKTD
ncbi:MAG: nucleotidyltransferase domain-containing protein [Nitrospirae bacterium]|nr:MAG: nucleotidyltransferase domain-containing protein [Nitrospirota bacterium]